MLMLMKIGPILQNPGRVLLHIIMVGLLSQVMNNANMNDSAILAGGKAQSLLSQEVEVNIVNEDHRDVDVIVGNETVNVVNRC
jgi:hypothetical protein